MSRDRAETWRSNVAAVVVDAAGNVLLGSNPAENRHHHFPQGGVKEGETFAEAVMRELQEETGLGTGCRIAARYGGLRYRYRADNPKSEKWKGQEQCYFLILCGEVCPPVAAQRGHEFSTFSWVPRQSLALSMFAPVKRKVIQPVLETFFPQGEEWSPELVAPRLSTARYRFSPGIPTLSRYAPTDRALFGGGKEEAEAECTDLATEWQRQCREQSGRGRTVILLFGMDGCGMKSCVRHLASCSDPLAVRIGTPLLNRPQPDYLWSLHASLPAEGEVLLLPSSPYDELLPLSPEIMARRAAHLSDFETMLTEEGIRLVKVFLHISENKFAEKKTTGMNPAEREGALQAWRNGNAAAASLLAATHHPAAPWHIIPSDRRSYRNIVLLRLLLDSR